MIKPDTSAGLYRPYLYMTFLVVLWGSFAAVSVLTLGYVDHFQILFYMFGSAFVVITIVLVMNGRHHELKALKWTEWTRLAVYALPSFLYYIFYFRAMQLIPIVEATMLNYLYPVMVILFAIPINGERLNAAKVVSLVLGFAGMAIVITNGYPAQLQLSSLTGDLLAVAAAMMWGIFSNLGKRNQVNHFISNYIYVAVSFILSVIALMLFSEFLIPGLQASIGLLWLGLSNIVLAYYLWFKALKSTSVAVVASFVFITPFISLFFLMLLTGERIGYWQIVGLLVIAASIFVSSGGAGQWRARWRGAK